MPTHLPSPTSVKLLIRAGLLVSGLSILAASPALSQELTPEKVVQTLYEDHAVAFANGNSAAKEFTLSEPFFFNDIADAMSVTDLGFDPLYAAQDADISDLAVRLDPELGMLRGTAFVEVTFKNFGKPMRLIFSLRQAEKEGNEWQIFNIEGDGWQLADMVKAKLKSASQPAKAQSQAEPQDPAPKTASASDKATDLVFILDASGSMWGQVDGVAKITTAKQALTGLMSDFDDSTKIGMLAYGHRNRTSCSDVEQLSPLLPSSNSDQIIAAYDPLKPLGRTPIALALEQAADLLKHVEDGASNRNVILISDGRETCEGDPCAAAAKLAAAGVDTKVHVVGFDLKPDERQMLECIAKEGKGRYFTADTVSEFKSAIKEAVQVAKAPEPAPASAPAPQPSGPIFLDEFKGSELGKGWQVINQDDESYIIENDELFIVAPQRSATLGKIKEAKNIFVLDQELPKGDWSWTMKVRGKSQTKTEQASLGLFQDEQNYVRAGVLFADSGCGPNPHFFIEKRKGKEVTIEEKSLHRSYTLDVCNRGQKGKDARAFFASLLDQMQVSLHRKGREVYASVTLPDPKSNEMHVFKSSTLGLLRAKGNLFMHMGHRNPGDGEGVFNVQEVRLEQN